jgi:hypothetical protein
MGSRRFGGGSIACYSANTREPRSTLPDLLMPNPWDEMIHLLQRLNFDHLDALELDPAATIAALAKREPDKAAWLLCEVMPGVQRQLSAYPKVVAGAAKVARESQARGRRD